MNGQSNCATLVGKSACNGLANPPGGIGGKLVTHRRIELANRLHEPEISLLNQVFQIHSLARVSFGNAHHEPEIAGYKLTNRIGITGLNASPKGDFFWTG